MLFAVPISTVNFLFDVFAKVRCTPEKAGLKVITINPGVGELRYDHLIVRAPKKSN